MLSSVPMKEGLVSWSGQYLKHLYFNMNTKLRIALIAGFATVALAAVAQNPPTDPADSSKAPPADSAPAKGQAAPETTPAPVPPSDAAPAPAPGTTGDSAKPIAED